MRVRNLGVFSVAVLVSLTSIAWSQARAPRGVSARWLGQDGHDLIGPSPAPAPAPNDVQDIHIQVSGLPSGARIQGARLVGLGGGEWVYNQPGGHWRLEVVQEEGKSTADLFFEVGGPETGRGWTLSLILANGASFDLPVRGGRADPNRRMPTAALQTRWVGQTEEDRTGPTPAVGPDGLVDARIDLDRLSPRSEVKALSLKGPGLAGWAYGTNPGRLANAELVRDPANPARAAVFFQPDANLAGQRLTLEITYNDGKVDRATVDAGATDPARALPAVAAPTFQSLPISARWLGQDGKGGTGIVHVALTGLPGDKRIAAVALSGSGRSAWTQQLDSSVPFWPDPYAATVTVEPSPDPTRADLFFPPERDESGQSMTLRLVFADRTSALVRFPGGPADPALWTDPVPADSGSTAQPGQDLQALVDRGGTIELAPGDYVLEAPLVLRRPVTLRATEPGKATLRFRQGPASPPWISAIAIHVGQVTLEGLNVRFAGPVRWNNEVSYGPAVIGSTTNLDPPIAGRNVPIAAVTLRGLDLEAPPREGTEGWVEAVRLARLVTVKTGRIESCNLRGGPIELTGGPWSIADNTYSGCLPGTASWAVLGVHNGHDLDIARNRISSSPGSGKTWRFLVLTDSGSFIRVESNQVRGVGPRDDDTIASANAPEIILTEAYRLHFEGRLRAVSTDGRAVVLPPPQGDPPRTGAILAVLDGAHAGRWHRVIQAIDPNTLVIDPPMESVAKSLPAISVATGFVDSLFQSNSIDSRGGGAACNLVLVGNHYGTQVLSNRLTGGGDAFKITSCPSESPLHWGWSHNPFLGGRIEGNVFADALRPGILAVEHDQHAKTSQGRVYFTSTLRDNRVEWSRPRTGDPTGINVGVKGLGDPSELRLEIAGNGYSGPPPAALLRVHNGTLNGRVVENRAEALPIQDAAR